jgi:hypothetical protein
MLNVDSTQASGWRSMVWIKRLACLLLALVAVIWLSYQFSRLVAGPFEFAGRLAHGPVDLDQRYRESLRWFGDESAARPRPFVYPPASYSMMWPVLTGSNFQRIRLIWALASLGAFLWMSRIFVRESGTSDRLGVALAALLPCSVYATGAGIGNGQLSHLAFPALIAGLLMAVRGSGWRNDLIASGLIVFALIKPNFSAPFFWIAMFVPGRLRVSGLVVAAYAFL